MTVSRAFVGKPCEPKRHHSLLLQQTLKPAALPFGGAPNASVRGSFKYFNHVAQQLSHKTFPGLPPRVRGGGGNYIQPVVLSEFTTLPHALPSLPHASILSSSYQPSHLNASFKMDQQLSSLLRQKAI